MKVVVYAGSDPRTGKERRLRRTVHGPKRAAQDVEQPLLLTPIRANHELTDRSLVAVDRDRYVRRLCADRSRWSPTSKSSS
jgi:hypothetical protein